MNDFHFTVTIVTRPAVAGLSEVTNERFITVKGHGGHHARWKVGELLTGAGYTWRNLRTADAPITLNTA